jgi:predicted CXXCH cytochrome family protein
MKRRLLSALSLFVFGATILYSQSVVNTVHNLSVSGPGSIKATSETEVCVFCHTPHNSNPSGPLWNRSDPGATYVLYNSSTLQAVPGQPDGSSVLCLSCHDGTIALGNVMSRISDISFSGGITRMPAGKSNLTTDLSDDHPVSFLYNSALSSSDGQLKDPSSVTYPVSLENGKVQCTSCHDPHKNLYNDFLVASTQFSGLCFKCHDRNYWAPSSHNTSTKTWNGTGTNPWLHTPYKTVAENGCENCHNPHSAGGRQRLMNFQPEENNCLNCHDGNVASKNIKAQFAKAFIHNVYGYNMTHDPVENTLVSTMHVECVDCHNPHAVKTLASNAPAANGFLAGVKGISQTGNPVNPAQYEYEVCYRCHADSPNKPSNHTSRQIVQNNVRLEFDISGPSYHPVTGPGKNPNCPSLISPAYNVASVIYCTDCHASNGVGAPAGPHGSIYPSILKYRYEKADNTIETASAYELCYSCHSRTSILNNVSFKEHSKHVSGEQAPCNTCHDPHGISSTQGNSLNNSSLINFDRSIVSPDGSGALRFVRTGTNSGYCLLRCHGTTHNSSMNY